MSQMFSVCSLDQRDASEMLTVANQHEIRTKECISVFCFSSIETKSKYFTIFFAEADFVSKIHRTPFSERHMQNFNIQDSTMNFKHSFKDQPKTVSFTTLIEKIFIFFSFIYHTISERRTCIKTNTVQTTHFPLKTSKTFLLKTENHEPLSLKYLKLIICQNWNDIFPSRKFYRRILKILAGY